MLNKTTSQKTWISCQAATTQLLKDIWKRWTRIFKVIVNQATGRGRTLREWENELCNRTEAGKKTKVEMAFHHTHTHTEQTIHISLRSSRGDEKQVSGLEQGQLRMCCCAHVGGSNIFSLLKKSRRVALLCARRLSIWSPPNIRERKFSVIQNGGKKPCAQSERVREIYLLSRASFPIITLTLIEENQLRESNHHVRVRAHGKTYFSRLVSWPFSNALKSGSFFFREHFHVSMTYARKVCFNIMIV